MGKFLYFALVCVMVGLAVAHNEKDHGRSWYGFLIPSFLTPTVSSICATPNNTNQLKYLSQMLTFINTAQANMTYNAVLQVQSANLLAYIKSPTSQGLLYSNCSAFVAGVVNAKKQDIKAARAREQISRDIDRNIRDIPRNVTGSKGPNDMDV